MITPNDVREFLNTQGADFSDTQIEEAISIASKRIKKLLGVESIPEEPEAKRAWVLLAVAELAQGVNLYWKGDKTELIKVKDLVLEAERLLDIVPKGALQWKEI